MRICYLANAASIHTVRWVKYFASKGHEVHLISPGASGENAVESVNLHLLPVSHYPTLRCYPIRIRRLLRRIEPDILHAHYILGYGLWGALSGFHPFILSVWGSDVLHIPNRIINRRTLEYSLKRADCVTTTSVDMRDYLICRHGLDTSKVIRIPWGVDLTIFKRGYEEEVRTLKASLGIGENTPVIISNRHMAPQYNIETIAKAIPLVIDRFPDAVFVFLRGYGTPSYEDTIRAEIEALSVRNNTVFISELLSPEWMAVYLNASDISISMVKYGQFGAGVIEAMICGTVPIASNIAVHRESLKDGYNAFLVDPEDSEELAEKIIRAIRYPQLKEKFYEINKKIVEEKEDWSKNASKMEEVYRNILKWKTR